MLAIDTETTGLFPHKGCQAFTISGACHNNKTYLWKFRVNPKTRQVIYDVATLQHFKDTLSQHEELIFHHANYDIQVLVNCDISVEYLFDNHDIHDTIVMSHVYNNLGMHGLKYLGVTLLGFPEDDEVRLSKITQSARMKAEKEGWCIANKHDLHPSLAGSSKDTVWRSDYWVPEEYARKHKFPSDHPWMTICDEYAVKDAVRTLGIYQVMWELLGEDQKKTYNKDRGLIRTILDMQDEKITLLPDELDVSKDLYNEKYERLLRSLCMRVCNPDFNPNSPKQLANILFDKYKFPVIKEGAKYPSTDKDVIFTLLQDCPEKNIPPKYKFLLDLKNLRKAKSTKQYLNNYSVHQDEHNQLQPLFKQWHAQTGRMAVENPNTTNVGKDDMNNPFTGKEQGLSKLFVAEDESFKLRNVFGPKPGQVWTAIDYQQFQLLIFAVASNTKELIDAFIRGDDLHATTGRLIFKRDDISSVERTAAKNCNFGVLFGAGPDKIERTAGVPGLYNLFLKGLPGAKRFLEESANQVHRKGYVHTLGGKRLYVPKDRAYAASCYIIQGTEAEIVREAMVDVSNYTYRNARPCPLLKTPSPCPYRMIMMVHDELVFRSDTTNKKHLRNIMRLMEYNGEKLGIPARVDAELITRSWADKEPIEI